jgi:hypothetical protein
MRVIAVVPLLALLAAPLLAADPPVAADPPKPLLQVRVDFRGPMMDLGEGKSGFLILDTEDSAPLESHITSLEIAHAAEARAQDGNGRPVTYTEYYIRLHLDAAGTAEIERVLKAARDSDKRFGGKPGVPYVVLDGSRQAEVHLIRKDDHPWAELRIVVTEKQLVALAAAVKQNWKPAANSNPAADWTEGKVPPAP